MSLHARLPAIQSEDLQLPQLPVIDNGRDNREALPGLRYLRQEVKRDAELSDRFLREDANPSTVSTNAPYLIAVWDELVHAHQPIAIYRTFSPVNGQDKGKKRATTTPVKVDIVAENGARWVRVNTIKNARLMMEFHEIDSYLTSDDEDELRPRLAQTEFDNSVLRMGRELLAAAKANPISVPFSSSATDSCPTTVVPKVTLRLTRLDPLKDDNSDPRIEQTIQCLRDMGIDVQLGERSYPPSAPIPRTRLKAPEPTTNINLDLSALIALTSDISHSPLPRTEHDAHVRFVPPQSYLDWKKDRASSHARQTDECTWENSGQHSRALAAQAIQEMNRSILEEIHECAPSTSVTFWTTSEARHRCLQIVSKIGGERERQRADALLGSTLCSRTSPVPAPTRICANGTSEVTPVEGKASAGGYWEHSRYPAGFLPLVPVRVYPLTLGEDGQARTTFFDALTRTCTRILNEAAPTADEELEDVPPAVQTSVPKLTVHTVASMLAGASRGHTTLTTNRSSVKAVLREMQRACGRETEIERAALWILDPRSLSEGMRSE